MMKGYALENRRDLEKDLDYLGLLHKAREIYLDLGDKAVLSYIRSSYHLLSKICHPDVNPKNTDKATMIQQRLNRVNHLISQMKDEELIELIRKGAEKQDNGKKKILVVEDEFGVQETLRDAFLMEGYDVRIAADGDRGYEVAREFEPDLILTDVVMPKMTGLELVAKVKEENPTIKVIFISGFFGIKRLSEELDKELLRYGYPFLSKPFRISAMLNLVKDYLNG